MCNTEIYLSFKITWDIEKYTPPPQTAPEWLVADTPGCICIKIQFFLHNFSWNELWFGLGRWWFSFEHEKYFWVSIIFFLDVSMFGKHNIIFFLGLVVDLLFCWHSQSLPVFNFSLWSTFFYLILYSSTQTKRLIVLMKSSMRMYIQNSWNLGRL